MTWTKTKIATVAALGLLLSCGVILVIQMAASRSDSVSNHSEPPFKFGGHNPIGGNDDRSRADIEPSGVAGFTSNIPVIVLRSERPGPVSASKSYSSFQMEIYESTDREPVCLCNSPTVSTPVALRLHGMVSRLFPKLSYRLKLQDGTGRTRGRSLLGMPADADWVLQGPWLDKSLVRNAFSYDLAKAMGCVAMRTRACEVFLSTSGQPATEADYVGVYQLTEDVERGEERVELAKLAPDENSEPAITGGYLLAWDVGDGRYLPAWKAIQVKYP